VRKSIAVMKKYKVHHIDNPGDEAIIEAKNSTHAKLMACLLLETHEFNKFKAVKVKHD